MPDHTIIVIGASAGGVDALIKLVRTFPPDLPAAIFIVLHIPAEGTSKLPAILNYAGLLPAVHPTDGMEIELGHIYIAPPDHHMLLEQAHIRVVKGPRENRHRPAIDPLFRSAALEYGPQVIGVILTGALDDGTAGLAAVKKRGGLTIVQDPKEALYSSMPESALEYVQIDYCTTLSDIGSLLKQLCREPAMDEKLYPRTVELEKEVKIAKMEEHTLSEDKHVGTPSVFSCPECGGVLWELQDQEITRFRCRVGHAFSLQGVQSAQLDAIEEALWTAYKTLQETVSLSRRMAKRAHQQGQIWLEKTFEERTQHAQQRADIIHNVLIAEKEKLVQLPSEEQTRDGQRMGTEGDARSPLRQGMEPI